MMTLLAFHSLVMFFFCEFFTFFWLVFPISDIPQFDGEKNFGGLAGEIVSRFLKKV
jgi:hypothetical protein